MKNQENDKQEVVEISTLIPKEWELSEIKNLEDLLDIGLATRKLARSYWRNTTEGLSKTIKRLVTVSDPLESRSIEEIVKLATEFKNPKFEFVGTTKLTNSDETIKCPIENEDTYKIGDTSFNVCGWCDFCDSSFNLKKGGCNLICSCGILNAINRNELAINLPFDTSCLVTKLSKNELEELRKKIQTKKEELVKEKRRVEGKIKFLHSHMYEDVPGMPLVPRLRMGEWLSKDQNELVVCFYEDKFVFGLYSHYQDIPDSKCNFFVDMQKIPEYVSYYFTDPRVLKIHEFLFFLTNPYTAERWLKMHGTKEDNWFYKGFLGALAEEVCRCCFVHGHSDPKELLKTMMGKGK